MKQLADSKESITLTNSSFKTYQEMLNDTINMFNRIVNDYATYDKYEPKRTEAANDISDLTIRILTLMNLAASLTG